MRVWFRCHFSVRDVHGQKGVVKGWWDEKKGVTQGVFVPWVRLFCMAFVLDEGHHVAHRLATGEQGKCQQGQCRYKGEPQRF